MWEKWSLYREKVGRVEGKNLNFLRVCVAHESIRHKHVWEVICVAYGSIRHKESPCATKNLNLSLCVKFVTHKHVHAPQRKVCVTFGEVIRDKQSWFCHSYPMRHIPHVTSLLFSCSVYICPRTECNPLNELF